MKKILVLDSLAGEVIKPSHRRAITKMWKSVKCADENLDACQCEFHVSNRKEIQQQNTDYDCGVYVCMFARTLVFKCPLVDSNHMMDQRKAIIHDLYFQTLGLSTDNTVYRHRSWFILCCGLYKQLLLWEGDFHSR